ncbi:MAG: hypothetical protein KF764_25435 [Labilithrix sp.]|nr:hypothetical protein [Labilithrix sp.]
MPRPKSDNTHQIAFKVPEAWLGTADEIAEALSRAGLTATRTDALRAALRAGLSELHAKHVSTRAGRKRQRK